MHCGAVGGWGVGVGVRRQQASGERRSVFPSKLGTRVDENFRGQEATQTSVLQLLMLPISLFGFVVVFVFFKLTHAAHHKFLSPVLKKPK